MSAVALSELRRICSQRLDKLKENGKFKEQLVVSGPQGTNVAINGREVVNFSHSDYFGLSNNPEVPALLEYPRKLILPFVK